MSEPYLILHKVRGEPAFDIAERCDDMGTASDPGPWWIISTSGHRAFPYWNIDLYEFVTTMDGMPYAPMPADWPDHYTPSSRSRLATAASDILSIIGLKPKAQAPVKRRTIP